MEQFSQYENPVKSNGSQKPPKKDKKCNALPMSLEQNSRVLQKQLENSQMFLNMVIHDMKNPTGATLIGLEKTKECIEKIIEVFNNHVQFSTSNDAIQENLQGDSHITSLRDKCNELLEQIYTFKEHVSYQDTEIGSLLDQVIAINKMTAQEYTESLEQEVLNDDFQFDLEEFEELQGLSVEEANLNQPNMTIETKQNILFLEKQNKIMDTFKQTLEYHGIK